MKFISQIKPCNGLATILADALSHEKYEAMLLESEDNNPNFEVSAIGTGYERQPLGNVITNITEGKVFFTTDPISFCCKGNHYKARRLAILANSIPNQPVVAYADIDKELQDGDKVIFDLSSGFISLSVC